MAKKVYLIETFKDINAVFALGFTKNKSYDVLDERKSILGIFFIKAKYKVKDDYGNVRWLNADWFIESEELRDDKINKFLE